MRRPVVLLSLTALTTLAVLVAVREKAEQPTPAPTLAAMPAPTPAATSPEETPAPEDTLLPSQAGGPMGSDATSGTSARNGIAPAIQEANASGGVKDERLGQGKPEEAAQASTRLINRDKATVLLAAAVPPEETPAPQNTLLLGQVVSLTGSEATFGMSARNGIALAIKETNAAGGVKGKKLAVRVYDSQGKPEKAAQAASRLITQDKVVLLLGEVTSPNSLAMAEKAQAAGVPMITPSSTNPKVTEKGDYIFRVCFIDPFQGSVMAKFARDNLKAEQVAILQDNKSAYSIGLTDVFQRKFTEMGGKITTTESYSQGDTDFRAQLTAIKKTKPQAIYVPGYYNDVGIIARQARELGLTVPLMGGDGWDSEKLFELAGNALDGSYFSNHYSPDNPDPRVQKFIADYKAAYGGVPDALAALGYDAAKVAIAALEKSKDLSGPAVRDAIAQTKDFPGVAGTITLDNNRNAVKSAVVLKIGDGKTKFVTTIKP